MNIYTQYTYKNTEYEAIRDPARGVVAAYQDAARFLDTIKEWVYIETGMIHTSEFIHRMAHEMPKRFDSFGDILHERHLSIEYPATNELTEEIGDMNRVFEFVISILDNIQEALERFHAATDNGRFKPMALAVEDLMMENSRDYTKVLEAWAMWNQDVSASSFDSWMRHISEVED